jgi:hypothetical protein
VPDHDAWFADCLEHRQQIIELKLQTERRGITGAVAGPVVGDHPVLGRKLLEDRGKGGDRGHGAGLEDDRRCSVTGL